MEFSGNIDNGPMNNGYILVAIRITDPDPDPNTVETCLGGDMHCPSASSFHLNYFRYRYSSDVRSFSLSLQQFPSPLTIQH